MCDHFFIKETVGSRAVLCVFDHFVKVTADDRVILVLCAHFFIEVTADDKVILVQCAHFFIEVTADDKVIFVMCAHFFSSQTYQLLFC